MADETKTTAAEKAPEVAPAAPAETEAPAEKSETAAPETTAASAPEEAAQAAPVEGQTSSDSAAATAATTKDEVAQPSSSSAAVETAPTTTAAAAAATTTTTATDDKAALDKETGVKTEGPDSSASSVVADKKDEEKPKDASPATAAAPAAEPAKEEPAKTEPVKAKTPLEEFDAKLPEILKEIGHDEMWGVTLVSPSSSHVPTAIVLQKFLNANDGDLTKAIDQFKGALKFRKDKKPLDLLKKTFSAHKFADLGAVTVYPAASKEAGAAVPEVFTWNLYGNVKGKMDEVFVPLNE